MRKTPRVADLVMQELEAMMLDGQLKAGEKLPPERTLAEQFQVSRPSIREVIQKLSAKGLIDSRQGGGHYICHNMGVSFSDPLHTLLEGHPEARQDLLEYRTTIEGACAWFAALRADEHDLARLTECFTALSLAHEKDDRQDEAEADVQFHLAIAQASHNVVFYQMMKGLCVLLERSLLLNISGLYQRQETRNHIFEQHKGIYEAICAAKPEAAKLASEQHLGFVGISLSEMQREKNRLARAILV
jgi:GntR family transcriptional repressor for pyruvate dehydrogenase complex